MSNRLSKYATRLIPILLVMVSLACSLPTIGRPRPTATILATSTTPPLPTPTPQPLPPALVESSPPQGAELPLEGPFTLYYNQPMDRASVEAELRRELGEETTFKWVDDSTVVLYPGQPLPPATDISFQMGGEIRSAGGMGFLQPVSLNYRTAGYLNLEQTLPEKDAMEVDPSSAVVAAFNRPVVPLGADPATLQAAFSLDPPAEGRGEWINTSTYIFYPEPGLEGGKTYRVNLNRDLRGTEGSPLQEVSTWSFTTAMPRLMSVKPETELPVPLDADFVLSFNQPMYAQSVQANFSLTAPDGSPVPGAYTWNENSSVVTYTLQSNLERESDYTINLKGEAQGSGGTPLGETFSALVRTFPSLAISFSEPSPGGILSPPFSPVLHFSAPIQYVEDVHLGQDVLQYVRITPSVPNLNVWWNPEELTLTFYGSFAPETAYDLRVSPNLPDAWGGRLGQEYPLNFTTTALPPNLMVNVGTDVLFTTPQDSSITAQATNLTSVPMSVGSVPLDDFLTMLGPNGYDLRSSYQPADRVSWSQPVDLPANQSQAIELPLTPDGSPLAPGLYLLRFNFNQEGIYNSSYLVVVSNLQLTFKLGATDTLVWAVNLRDNTAESNTPVTLFDENGSSMASGQTDNDGVFKADLPPRENPYSNGYAVIGQPGQDNFGMSLSYWDTGVAGWDFGIPMDFSPPGLKAYLYTDRPIYRPGQTVYFRAVVRQAFNGRYTLPDMKSLPVVINSWDGTPLVNMDLPLSAYGTAHGEYTLPGDAQPGTYSLTSPAIQQAYLGFQVAEYRKPEINLQVSFSAGQALAGEDLDATVNARYFFDAPAGNVPVHWALYAAPSYFDLPGYQVGVVDIGWMDAFPHPHFRGSLGDLLKEGDAKTKADGTLSLTFPTETSQKRQRYTLEVTATDESGQPVSGRDSVEVNPAQYYIGTHPEAWVGRAKEASSFDVLVVDWEGKAAGAHNLRAEFQKVTWERQEAQPGSPETGPIYIPKSLPPTSTDFSTNDQGQARVEFTPPEPGTYLLNVFSLEAENQGASSELLLWVGGAGEAIFPDIPNARLRLTTDKDSYLPGETAQVFIPNPFTSDTLALITVERGKILRDEVMRLAGGGQTLNIPLSAEDAPNVYVSVTLIGQDFAGKPDFRQGFVNLPVEPLEQTLSVTLTSEPERAGPGQEVTFSTRVTDSAGKPVQGEFSLSVVDLAALALADPNAPPITTAFYGEQPLGVRTANALAAYARRSVEMAGGMGGGGELVVPVVRESFPDTAYWNAELVTDADGRAQVTLNLPDTLTTWQVQSRGTTSDTRVGEAETQTITSKELLIRPVTPRFLVVNDHVLLAAIVQNNTASEMDAAVTLQPNGLILDEPDKATRQVNLHGGGRARLEWWGKVLDVPSADLVFATEGKDAAGKVYQDAARPALGKLPILRYTAPQAYRTSGVLESADEILELVSLPRSFDPDNGGLSVELSPSLAAALGNALDVLEHYPYECTEQTLSRFLPNLESYRALSQFGVDSASLKARLERTLNEGVTRLESTQNPDGGWGWWQGGESDPYITAYILFGLAQTQQAGVQVSEGAFQRASNYLKNTVSAPDTSPASSLETWQLDRLAFENFALTQVGEGDEQVSKALYALRDQLDPWAQGFLALTFESLQEGSEESRTLVSDLEATAVRSSTGVHWELLSSADNPLAYQQNLITTLSNSAIVIYALAQREPGSPLLADAVRYLMSNRGADGAWYSTYTTAWTVLAMNEVVKGTGELGGDFTFGAALNGAPLASGQAAGAEQLTPAKADVPISDLYPDYPNDLAIRRSAGQGRLYYTAALKVSQPVEKVVPLSQGLSLRRAYYPSEDSCPQGDCAPIKSAQVGEKVTVRLTLTLNNAAYNLLVEDSIPAGTEILNTSLKTSQQGLGEEPGVQTNYDPSQPFAGGWGWWLFHPAQIYDDRIAWAADHLPAGTYELTYTLLITQPGEYRTLPARAWEFYFPEVQATSDGIIFEIKP